MGNNIITCLSKESEQENTEEKIDTVIDNVWREIDISINKYQNKYEGLRNNTEKTHGWRVVRLFISSTFADFHAEREVLIKKVMPELREWCEKYRIHLIECDLRWGVPKNTDSIETIQICLDEIGKCIRETNGQPFFLNLLGERYGWIPQQRMSSNALSAYDWVYPTSITHMELIHAALHTASPNSLFLLRDPLSLENLPEEFNSSFRDNTLLAQKSLDRLKEELSQRYPDRVLTYKANVCGIDVSTGAQKVKFEGLDALGDLTLNFFKARISEYASQSSVDQDNDQTSMMQQAFIEKRGRMLIGREEEIKAMMNFATNLDEEKEKCLFIIAEPGMGKSSLVANYVLKLNEENIPCLYNFSSSSPGSTSSTIVIRRFCEELLAKLNEKSEEMFKELDGLENEITKLFEKFASLLKEVSIRYPRFTIVLDAVNEFQDGFGTACEWLPVPSAELNVRYVISCPPNFGDKFKNLTEKFESHSRRIYLSGFDENSRQELVSILFSHYNKKLDPEQMQVLTNLKRASSPLWLALACEELRVFGVFEQLTEKIKSLPDSIGELISLIISRVLLEDETGKVKKAFCYLACSTYGLTESELCVLLADLNEQRIPMITWLTVRRKMKMFLLNTGLRGDEDMYKFFHSTVREVVSTELVTDEAEKCSYHVGLANYFIKHGHNDTRTSRELFSQLQQASMNTELIKFIRNDKRSLKISGALKELALRKLRCKVAIMPGNSAFKFQVHICNMCSIKTGLSTPGPLLTKNVCIVCGRFTPRKDNQAFVCNKHRQFCAPKTDKCFFCKKVIFLEQKSPVPLYDKCYCCVMCSGRSCVMLVP